MLVRSVFVRSMKAWWLVAAFVSGVAFAMWAEELILHWRDNHLYFSAPRMNFLAGPALDRLHNGADVPFDFQITLWSGNKQHVYSRTAARFVVSWDIWEEKFKVVKMQSPRKATAHLDARGAEAWCQDQMPIDVSGLSETEPFWARLEIRVPEQKDSSAYSRTVGESGISLASLIELFSRPPAVSQAHWTIDSPALTIDELKRGYRRGS